MSDSKDSASDSAQSADAPETKPDTKEKKSKAKEWLVFLLFFVVFMGALGAAGFYGWQYYIVAPMSAPGPATAAQTITIKPGRGVQSIARQLEAAGIIDYAWRFRIKARLVGKTVTLKAGEYSFSPHISLDDVFSKLQNGKIVQHSITLPEGRTVREMLDIIRQSPVLSGKITEVPPEGSLLPETYAVTRGMGRMRLIRRMQGDMQRALDAAWKDRAADLPLASKQEALILASIVEKETGLASERPRVAAVFINRLRRRMRLESDPTILYGLNGGQPLGRGLRRSEIDKKTAWNTYQIDGLPPTPICNPGRDAILAVLHPAPTKDLYFVADGSGGHVFASTYRQHLRNVAQWRRLERKRKRAKQ